jgi:phosphonoacetaldehyde hydrolase
MESPFSSLQCVVFDWAGTTVDFGCQGPVQAFVECFAALGVEITAAEARGPMGMGKRDHVAALCALPRVDAAWRDVYGASPTEADIDRIYRRVECVMGESVRRYSTPIPGVVEAVEDMRRLRLRIGSCTGYPRSVGETLADRAREFGYVTDPSRAVKVGDTVNDVLEGVQAGMWVIGVTLSGSLAGLSEDELAGLTDAQKWMMHSRISDVLTEAGAHFTIPDVASCLPVLRNIDDNRRNNFKPRICK